MNAQVQQKKFRSSADVDPEKDGVDFINIYSQGRTRLGRNLSHFARSQFVHPYFGPFQSMEGFWFYMKTGKKFDELRYLYGIRAKQLGRTLRTVHYPEFHEDILAGNYQKLLQDDGLRQAFTESTLPLTHYYLFKPKVAEHSNSQIKPVVIFPKNSDWLIDGLEDIRNALKERRVPDCWTNAAKRYTSDVTDKVN